MRVVRRVTGEATVPSEVVLAATPEHGVFFDFVARQAQLARFDGNKSCGIDDLARIGCFYVSCSITVAGLTFAHKALRLELHRLAMGCCEQVWTDVLMTDETGIIRPSGIGDLCPYPLARKDQTSQADQDLLLASHRFFDERF